MKFKLTRGSDIPIPGVPEQRVAERKHVSSVALIGDDYLGLVPSLLVSEGARVELGQPVAKAASGYSLCAPGTGVVSTIRSTPGRPLAALVIALDDPTDSTPSRAEPPASDVDATRRALLAAGLWTALRSRPFGGVADPRATPRALFVTAMDSDPLAARPDAVLAERAEDFAYGLEVLARLTDGPLHVCKAPGTLVPVPRHERVLVHEFAGRHPAGLPGTHMHFLDPVGRGRTAWHLAAADVPAIGRFFRTGELDVERVVALGGPRMARPRLVRTRLGANIDELTAGELLPGACRVLSGSPLSGRQATSWGRHLGRYHRQVCALEEARPGAAPPMRRSTQLGSTALGGRPAAMVPSGAVERMMPLDLLTTPLLRALLVGDLETAAALGCLELVEEDLALCTYACPSKIDYAAYLRAALTRIEASS